MKIIYEIGPYRASWDTDPASLEFLTLQLKDSPERGAKIYGTSEELRTALNEHLKEISWVSSDTYDHILYKVDGKYGAPMGRNPSVLTESYGRIYDRKVSLTDGYDKGGAYWGNGPELRVKYSLDGLYYEFYRL